MRIRLFDPTIAPINDYRHRYPELERTREFDNISSHALVFVWWYANATSPLMVTMPDEYERVEEAMKLSGFTVGKGEKEKILNLNFDSDLATAIEKMSKFDPGVRYSGYKMLKGVFERYESILNQGEEAFKTIEGKGESQIEYIDYKRYVDTTSKIIEAIPELVHQLEEGFGIVEKNKEDAEEESSTNSLRDFHRSRAE